MHRRGFVAGVLSASVSQAMFPWMDHASAQAQQSIGAVKERDILITYNSNDGAEVAAAQELGDYLQRMAECHPLLVDGNCSVPAQNATVRFIVGRTISCQGLISAGSIGDPAKKNNEAYIVRSVSSEGNACVVILGGSGIATLYAVYHYLEKVCGCGFYWDGDHVPRLESLPVRDIDIEAQPQFRERMCMNLTLYWYSCPWWEWQDWKRYIDWTLKSRFNILSLWDTPGEDLAWREAWKRMGVEISDDSYSGPPYGIFAPIKYGVRPPLTEAWREGQSALNKQIIQYARARGMRCLTPAVSGICPPEYISAHPEVRTFEISWSGLPKQKYLHPLSPQYHEVGKAFLEEYSSLYGTDHIYWLENYLECNVEGTEDVQADVRREIAGANFRVIDELDSQGVGVLSAWTTLSDPRHWTPQLVQESLERIPTERIRILDQWTEMDPEHKRTNYFNGRPWHLGVIYSFAGNTNLHGNMRFIEGQIRNVLEDPRARQCVGFYPSEETILHNYFYYSFLCRLGWNPKEVELSTFVRDYARERYGEDASSIMSSALDKLLASVYGTDDLTQPLYWHRLGTSEEPIFRLSIANRKAFIPLLRSALDLALRVSSTQISNPLYLHDLNDIARQYLAELFTAHVAEIKTAFGTLDRVAFEREARLLESFLQSIETLLSHDEYYWLSPLIRKAQKLPGAPVDVDRRARDIYTLWADVIRDYASRDYYELVLYYYHPRVKAYIRTLRNAMILDQRMLFNVDQLSREYETIEHNWVDDGFRLIEQEPNPGQIVVSIRSMLTEFASAENV